VAHDSTLGEVDVSLAPKAKALSEIGITFFHQLLLPEAVGLLRDPANEAPESWDVEVAKELLWYADDPAGLPGDLTEAHEQEWGMPAAEIERARIHRALRFRQLFAEAPDAFLRVMLRIRQKLSVKRASATFQVACILSEARQDDAVWTLAAEDVANTLGHQLNLNITPRMVEEARDLARSCKPYVDPALTPP
jgi:hypothetical protein